MWIESTIGVPHALVAHGWPAYRGPSAWKRWTTRAHTQQPTSAKSCGGELRRHTREVAHSVKRKRCPRKGKGKKGGEGLSRMVVTGAWKTTATTAMAALVRRTRGWPVPSGADKRGEGASAGF